MDWHSEITGPLAMLGVGLKWLWDISDRAEKKLAGTIRASDVVRDAVGDVAQKALEDAKVFPTADAHEALCKTVDEIKADVKESGKKLDTLLLLIPRRRFSDKQHED